MITEEDTIENIFIDECKSINVMNIYAKIKNIKTKKIVYPHIIFQNKNCLIKLKEVTGDKYILESKNKKNNIINSIELLKKPLKIYDEDNPDEEIIDIVNPQQLEDIKKKYINYQFFCESTGMSKNFSELILGQIIKHNLCNKKHFIKKNNKYKYG